MARNNGRFQIKEGPGTGNGLLIAGIILLFVPGPGWIVGLGLLIGHGKRKKERARYERYLRYCSVLGSRERVPARELARLGGLGIVDTRAELQRMISEGYFGRNAFFDTYADDLVIPYEQGQTHTSWLDSVMDIMEGLKNLHFGEDPGRQYQYRYGKPVAPQAAAYKPEPKAEAKPAPQPAPKQEAKPAPKPQPQPEPVNSRQAELEKVLRELYELNEKIQDPGVSQRIDRIGELTAGIYGAVIQNPEREQDVHKFMTYYLPTTLKLLKSYDLLEHQSYQGENIQESRKKIEGILDTLIAAFEKQLDHLFRNDAMDIAADVKALETVIAGDGLSDKGVMQMPM